MKKAIVSIVLLSFTQIILAQTHVLPGDKSKYLYDRWQILYGTDPYASSIGNTTRKDMFEFADELRVVADLENDADIKYVIEDNSDYYVEKEVSNNKSFDGNFEPITKEIAPYPIQKRKPIWGAFYETNPFLYQVNNKNFTLRVRPLLNIQFGKELDNDNNLIQNTRGLEIRGTIDEKIYFYSNILENQVAYPSYLEDNILHYETVPGNGFYKRYKGSLGGDFRGFDYLNSQAYLGYHLTNSVNMELGHGRHFIGDGIRSLMLSDYSHNYFYLKLNARFWKFNYQTIFAELAPVSTQQNPFDLLLPKKYSATHYLSYMPNRKFQISLFESVIFSRQNHFEFQYLNPVILYRTVEQFIDSPDNVLLGLSARYNFLNHFQFYTQFVLDEFKSDEIFSSEKWWANKYAFQAGLKYVNVLGIKNLDIQYEYNMVRPYMYSHRETLDNFENRSIANYSHHNQPLAHPLGANFREHIVNVNYRPISKLWLQTRAYYAKKGLDKEESVSYGGDILLPSSQRPGDYGVELYQGDTNTILGLDFIAKYEIFHGLNLEANYLRRTQKGDTTDKVVNYIGAGISYNLTTGIRNY